MFATSDGRRRSEGSDSVVASLEVGRVRICGRFFASSAASSTPSIPFSPSFFSSSSEEDTDGLLCSDQRTSLVGERPKQQE